MERLKKVTRYLIGRERAVWKSAYQDTQRYAYVYADSDWGGDNRIGSLHPGGYGC